MIDPDPLFLLYWLLRGPSCGRDCGVVPGRRRATRICQYARNILQAGSGKPAGNAVSWHLLMHLADMRHSASAPGHALTPAQHPRLRYPTRWPPYVGGGPNIGTAPTAKRLSVVSGPTYGEIPTLGKLIVGKLPGYGTLPSYEAHNHRQRDKYWPTADASLFERRRRAIL